MCSCSVCWGRGSEHRSPGSKGSRPLSAVVEAGRPAAASASLQRLGGGADLSQAPLLTSAGSSAWGSVTTASLRACLSERPLCTRTVILAWYPPVGPHLNYTCKTLISKEGRALGSPTLRPHHVNLGGTRLNHDTVGSSGCAGRCLSDDVPVIPGRHRRFEAFPSQPRPPGRGDGHVSRPRPP